MNDGFSFSNYGTFEPGLTSLTATGTTQATAAPLRSKFNRFTVVPPLAGCQLPAVVIQTVTEIVVINSGANMLYVYPPIGGTIDGLAVNAPASLTAGQVANYICYAPPAENGMNWTTSFQLQPGAPGAFRAGAGVPSDSLGQDGDYFLSTDTGNLYLKSGGHYTLVGNLTNKAIIAATPPGSVVPGTLWWDDVGGQLYIYYDDGNSAQWVIANSVIANAGGPFLPLSGGTMSGQLGITYSLGTVSSATAQAINSTAGGSGTNGPATAQFGLNINHIKTDWSDPVQSNVHAGEIDGISVFCRQGGSNSDCGGILINVQNTGLSFLAAMEMASTVVNPANSQITKYVNVQLATNDGPSNQSHGAVIQAAGGSLNDALHVQDNNAGSTWTNVLTNTRNNVQNFALDASGNITTSGSVLINTAGSGYLTVQGHTSGVAVPAGANLMWSHDGHGGTWLINQKGAGTGGIHLAEADAGGNLTERLIIDGTNGTFTLNGDVISGGRLVAGTGEVYLRSDFGLGLRWASNQFQFEISGSPVAYIDNAGIGSFNAIHANNVYLRPDTAISILWDGGAGGIQFNISGNAAEILGSGGLSIFGTKVVGTQITGWGTPTGGSRTASFNGASATLAQTSATLAQLILDLKAHGLLGA